MRNVLSDEVIYRKDSIFILVTLTNAATPTHKQSF
jgi:hypothetical protein